MSRAFTLVETIIIIAISVCIFLALTSLIFYFNNAAIFTQALEQSSGSASSFMREIRTLAVPANAVLQTHTFPSGTYASSASILVLEIPSIDSSGNVIANTYDYAAFYLTGTNAYRLLSADGTSSRVSGTKQLGSTMSGLTFTYDNADFTLVNTVTADVQTQVQVKQSTLTDHRTEQVRLRNH